MTKRVKYEESSGNVFADLGLRNPEERLLKANLALEISRIIEAKKWTQTEAAEFVGLDQPTLSRLLRGRLSGFSVDRLFRILTRLGHNIEVRVSSKKTARAKVSVAVV